MSRNTTQKNILIIDDDLTSTRVLEKALQAHNEHSITVVYDGEEGYKTLHERKQSPNQYDLLILEMLTPTLTGNEVCERMLGDTILRDIPVILVSLLPLESPEFKKSLATFPEFGGVKGILQKPFPQKDFDDILVKELKKIVI